MRILASTASALLLGSVLFWSHDSYGQTIETTALDAAMPLTLPNGHIRVTLAAGQFADIALANGEALKLLRHEDTMSIYLSGEAGETELYRGFAAFPPGDTASVWVADANFDGLQDLLVQTNVGYAGVNVYFDVLLAGDNGFADIRPEFDLTGLSNPEIDPDMQQIRVSERSGPTWYNSVYELADGRLYREHTMTLAGEGLEYVRFYKPNGHLAHEMITGALADDPRDWKALTVELPEGALFPLRMTPEADSAAIEPFPARTNVVLRRLSQDGMYLLLEHADSGEQGWIKTEWLPLPNGFDLY